MRKVLALSLAFLVIGTTAAQAITNPVFAQKKCDRCHAMPPEDDGRFKAGAHDEHATILCNECHLTGIEDDHVNGVITLKTEIEYQYGSQVPWPGTGGGSCGGSGTPMQMPGCHERLPKAKCFWVPGKSCRSPESN